MCQKKKLKAKHGIVQKLQVNFFETSKEANLLYKSKVGLIQLIPSSSYEITDWQLFDIK